jgi:hypothetical protein
MSPRAAWRLEQLGYQVADYVAGKADWLAAGLPVEGTEQPAGLVLHEVDTCGPDDTPAPDTHECVVVNDDGVVLGMWRHGEFDPGPSTERADADPDDLRTRMAKAGADSYLITTPGGVLLGAFRG